MHRIRLVFFGLFMIPPVMAQVSADTVDAEGGSVPFAADTLPLPADTLPSAHDTAYITIDTMDVANDTLAFEPVVMEPAEASEYLSWIMRRDSLWRPSGDTFRVSLARLADHISEPFDSVAVRLERFEFDSIKLQKGNVVRHDTLPLRWFNDSTFMIDTMDLERDPVLVKKYSLMEPVDTLVMEYRDTIADLVFTYDSVVYEERSFTERHIDTAYLDSLKLQLYRFSGEEVEPPLFAADSLRGYRVLSGEERLVYSDTLKAILGNPGSPFYMVPGMQTPDSLRVAVETLLAYTRERDSVLLYLDDIEGRSTPFWITTGKESLYRYWVRNFRNDSVTVWLGNPSRNHVSVYLEQDVNINRIEKAVADDIPISKAVPELALATVEPLKKIPVFWDYDFSSALSFNQTYLSNWSKGGESSVATMVDIKGSAKYKNTADKTEWTNSGRLKYGSIITGEYGLRTNTDMLELNSQFNKVIREKIDFSTVFYMKNQLARGYNYPNDSVVVSKFLNPLTFTVGVGVEYKPFKKTLLNFSPLSYKNTTVLDTAMIDQTIHGIEADKRVRQEMGGQLTIKNSMTILEDLNISNSVRLFSNYFNNPQNVDVDWELSLDKRINWYATVSLNLHLIYDDDIRFPVLDDNDEPVLLPDGSPKKSPKLQFKEFVGLTFSFTF